MRFITSRSTVSGRLPRLLRVTPYRCRRAPFGGRLAAMTRVYDSRSRQKSFPSGELRRGARERRRGGLRTRLGVWCSSAARPQLSGISGGAPMPRIPAQVVLSQKSGGNDAFEEGVPSTNFSAARCGKAAEILLVSITCSPTAGQSAMK